MTHTTIHNPSKLPNTKANITGIAVDLLFPCSCASVVLITEVVVTPSAIFLVMVLVILLATLVESFAVLLSLVVLII